MSGGAAGASVESIIDFITNQIPGTLEEYTAEFSDKDKENAVREYLELDVKKEAKLPTFKYNERVIVYGLTSDDGKKMNGKAGKVVGPLDNEDKKIMRIQDTWDGRYDVYLDGDPLNKKQIRVKNLKRNNFVCVNPLVDKQTLPDGPIRKRLYRPEVGVCKQISDLTPGDKQKIAAREMYKKVQTLMKNGRKNVKESNETEEQFEQRMSTKYAPFLRLRREDGQQKYSILDLLGEKGEEKEKVFNQFKFNDNGVLFAQSKDCLFYGKDGMPNSGICTFDDKRKIFGDPNSSYRAWTTFFEGLTPLGEDGDNSAMDTDAKTWVMGEFESLSLFNGNYERMKDQNAMLASVLAWPEAGTLRENMMDYLYTISKILCYDITELPKSRSSESNAFVQYAQSIDEIFSNPSEHACTTALKFLQDFRAGKFEYKNVIVSKWRFSEKSLHAYLLRFYELRKEGEEDDFFMYYADEMLRSGIGELPFEENQERCEDPLAIESAQRKPRDTNQSVMDFVGMEGIEEGDEGEYDEEYEEEDATVFTADGPLRGLVSDAVRESVIGSGSSYMRTVNTMLKVYKTVDNRYQFFRDVAEYLRPANQLNDGLLKRRLKENASAAQQKNNEDLMEYGEPDMILDVDEDTDFDFYGAGKRFDEINMSEVTKQMNEEYRAGEEGRKQDLQSRAEEIKKELEERKEKLKEIKKELKETKKELEERKEELEERMEELEERMEELEERMEELEEKKEELEDKKEELKEDINQLEIELMGIQEDETTDMEVDFQYTEEGTGTPVLQERDLNLLVQELSRIRGEYTYNSDFFEGFYQIAELEFNSATEVEEESTVFRHFRDFQDDFIYFDLFGTSETKYVSRAKILQAASRNGETEGSLDSLAYSSKTENTDKLTRQDVINRTRKFGLTGETLGEENYNELLGVLEKILKSSKDPSKEDMEDLEMAESAKAIEFLSPALDEMLSIQYQPDDGNKVYLQHGDDGNYYVMEAEENKLAIKGGKRQLAILDSDAVVEGAQEVEKLSPQELANLLVTSSLAKFTLDTVKLLKNLSDSTEEEMRTDRTLACGDNETFEEFLTTNSDGPTIFEMEIIDSDRNIIVETAKKLSRHKKYEPSTGMNRDQEKNKYNWVLPHGRNERTRFFYLQRKFLLQMEDQLPDKPKELPLTNTREGLRPRKQEVDSGAYQENTEKYTVTRDFQPGYAKNEEESRYSMMFLFSLSPCDKMMDKEKCDEYPENQEELRQFTYDDDKFLNKVFEENLFYKDEKILNAWEAIMERHWDKCIETLGLNMTPQDKIDRAFKHSVYFIDPLHMLICELLWDKDSISEEEKELFDNLKKYANNDGNGIQRNVVNTLITEKNRQEVDSFFETKQAQFEEELEKGYDYEKLKEDFEKGMTNSDSGLIEKFKEYAAFSDIAEKPFFFYENCRSEEALSVEKDILNELNVRLVKRFVERRDEKDGNFAKAIQNSEINNEVRVKITGGFGHRIAQDFFENKREQTKKRLPRVTKEQEKKKRRRKTPADDRNQRTFCNNDDQCQGEWICRKPEVGPGRCAPPPPKKELSIKEKLYAKREELKKKRKAEEEAGEEAKRQRSAALIAAVAAGMRRTRARSLRDTVRDAMGREKGRRELGTSLVSDVDVTEASFDAMARLDSGVRYTFPSIGSRVYVLERPVPGEEVYTLRAEDDEGVFVAGARGRTTAVAIVDEGMRAASELSDLGLAHVIGAAVAIGHCGEKGCDDACCEEMEMGIGCSCGEGVSDEAAGVIGDAYAANKDDATIADMIDLDAGEEAEGAAAIVGDIVSIHDLVSV